jgi:SAM-dependent methyltransferase
MTNTGPAISLDTARLDAATASEGRSDDAILELVGSVARSDGRRFQLAVDIGCGQGDLHPKLREVASAYVGCDLVRYDGLSPEVEFRRADLNGHFPFDDGFADLVVSAETIEHLENPRHFLREITRIARAGARIIITTPNQLSLLSKLCLLVKNRFSAFLPVHYPAHITALLESDLVLAAKEAGLDHVRIVYSDSGRIPGTARHWPRALRGRPFSDNLALVAAKP